jgi:hypothetical protein
MADLIDNTSVYPSIIIEAFISGSWLGLSSDVIGDVNCNYGISGNTKLDRIADVGELDFTLLNLTGKYSPNSSQCIKGWKKGIPVRLKVFYSPDTVTKFLGHINSLGIDPINKIVEVSCLDYMDYLNNYPLNLVNVTSNKKISEVVALILSGMNQQPQSVAYNVGQDTFTAVFDSVNENTKALSEINKLALSEFGYVYVKHGNPTVDETLVVEGRRTRNFLSNLDQIPKNGEFLLIEDGSNILNEDGSRLMINDLQPTTFDGNMADIELNYGDAVINQLTVKSYPRRIDTSPQVLWSLGNQSPIFVGAGTSASMVCNYKDPKQTAQSIAGMNMQPLISGSANDYSFFSGSAMSGTNLTGSLVITPTYYANNALIVLKNTSLTDGYVCNLQLRGYGIYIDQPLNYQIKDATSINSYGLASTTLDMKYQSSPFITKSVGDQLLQQFKNPFTKVDNVSFLANKNDLLMLSFMNLDIGSLIWLKEAKAFIEGYYYINSINFTVSDKRIINFTWGLSDALSVSDVYWILGTSTLGVSTILGY